MILVFLCLAPLTFGVEKSKPVVRAVSKPSGYARVDGISGKVWLNRGKERLQLQAETELQPNDTVETEKEANARIVTVNGNVTMSAWTTVSLYKVGGTRLTTILELLYGTSRVESTSFLELRIPNAHLRGDNGKYLVSVLRTQGEFNKVTEQDYIDHEYAPPPLAELRDDAVSKKFFTQIIAINTRMNLRPLVGGVHILHPGDMKKITAGQLDPTSTSVGKAQVGAYERRLGFAGGAR